MVKLLSELPEKNFVHCSELLTSSRVLFLIECLITSYSHHVSRFYFKLWREGDVREMETSLQTGSKMGMEIEINGVGLYLM